MDSTRLNELIQSDLDGELSAAGRAELARLVLQDPEARRLHDQFRRLDQLLRDIPQAEPPAGLRAAILDARGAPARPAAHAVRVSGLPAWRMAAAVFAVAILTAVGYMLLDTAGPQTELQGSLGAASGPALTVSAAPLDQLSILAEGVEVSAALKTNGDGLLLELRLAGSVPYQVAAVFDPTETVYVGKSGAALVADSGSEVLVKSGIGLQDFALEFSRVAPIRLQVRANGRLLGEGQLSAIAQ